MTTSRTTLACFLLATLAGVASAQSTSQFVSGFEHDAVGQATFDPAVGRRLPIRNIGSSGQDGVEIKLRTAYGGGVTIDPGVSFKKKPGAEIKIKHKGWDGMIYGTHRMMSNGDGTGVTVYDYSDVGATGIQITRYNEMGEVISDELFPGPIAAKPWVPDNVCPNGGTPIPWGRWVKLCDSCNPVWVEGWMCLGTNDEYSYNNGARTMIIPMLPPGQPFPDGLDSTTVTALGIPSFAVENVSMGTFGVMNWGVGGGRPVEECNNPDCSERVLLIQNIGSSGQDGVSVDVGPHAGETDVSLGRKKYEGWDMKENTKFYDEEGTCILGVGHGLNPTTGEPALSLDFSGVGADGYTVTYFDPNGQPLGSEWKINYDPSIGIVLCPKGWRERWIQGNDGLWHFFCCDQINGIVIPGQGPIGPVSSMMFTPGSGGYHRVRSFTTTGSSDADDIILGNVSVTPACEADFDHTGFVDTDDFDAFVQAFEAGTEDADFDGSGFVDTDDFDAFVQAFELGC